MKEVIGWGIIVVFVIIFFLAVMSGGSVLVQAGRPVSIDLSKIPTPPSPPPTPTFQEVKPSDSIEKIEVQVTLLTKQVEKYTQDVNVYTQAVNAYTQQVAAQKTFMDASTAGDTRRATAFTTVVKDGLLPVATTIVTALAAFAFAAAGGQALQTIVALRGITDAEDRKSILKSLPKFGIF